MFNVLEVFKALRDFEVCSSNSFVEVSNFIPSILDMYKYFDIIIIISINIFKLLKGLIDFDNKISFM